MRTHLGSVPTVKRHLAAIRVLCDWLVVLRRLLREPTLWSGALLGIALGLALATKFTTLIFLPPVLGAIVACHYSGPSG
jgi:4-amino-4-deoxy-L-arabinose transferase-like glycosyltransferase